MWHQVVNIIILLNNMLSANSNVNTTEVTWKEAQKICRVPSVSDIMYTNKFHTELPPIFTAWTSSRNLASDWSYFYGCLDVSVKINTREDVYKALYHHFPNSSYATKSNSVFQCAYSCTSKGDLFTFHRQICKCIHQYELTTHVEKSPACIVWKVYEVDNVDKVYSRSRNSLPIFKFEKDLRTKSIQQASREHQNQYCLAKRNGTFTKSDCNSTKMFKCEEDSIGRGTWTSAIYKCAVDNSSRLKNNSPYFDYWLPYFIYEEDKGNTQCVAITKDNISRSPTYQFRTCSDRISVLCYDENDSSHLITTVIANRGSQLPAISTEPILDRTMNQTTSNLPSVQKLGIMVMVNVVLLGLCIIFVIMIMLRKRFTSHVRTT